MSGNDEQSMIGQRIGPLLIVRLLSFAGARAVYEAEHATLGIRRAVKVLRPEFATNHSVVERFYNEARAISRLTHRNLVQVHDVGQLENGRWFVVFDYLEGRTLGELMASYGGPVPPQMTVRIVSQIANVLSVVHRVGLIHRDLKPENVFLTIHEGDPLHVRVIDWGSAQLHDCQSSTSETQTGLAIGTPAYMSTEQLRGACVGPSADVFALGTIAYTMSVGGDFPYQFESSRDEYCKLLSAEISHRQMSRPPTDPRERNPHISAGLASALLAAIDPDPAKRPSDPGTFALMLAEHVTSDGVNPDGLEIVRTYARELLRSGDVDNETVRSPSAPLASTLAAAQQPDPRYRVLHKLGTGGMAEVYLATMSGAEGFSRTVAIKRVMRGLGDRPEFAAMFIAEATIVARLSHPNIVSVIDFSRDSDGLFLVMEYIDGVTLAALLNSGAVPASVAIYVTVEMLRALGYAHRHVDPASNIRGVLHRDVSPHNLLLSFTGVVKLTDFGLAKALESTGGAYSTTVRGKPRYMSPEQLNAEPLDNRSDLFAVGIVLWEALANRKLFDGLVKEIMAQVFFQEILEPSNIRKGVPADLEAIAMKLLDRDRDHRFPSAEAAIDALLRCNDAPRDGRGELVHLLSERFRRQDTGVQVPPTTSTLEAASTSSPLTGERRARRWPIIATVTALAVSGAAAGGLVVYVNAQREPAPTIEANSQIAITPAPVDVSAAVVDAAVDSPPSSTTAVAHDAAIVDAGSDPSTKRIRPRIEFGHLRIRMMPWADVYMNGKRVGATPFDRKLPVGKHEIVLANDIQKKTFTVTVTTTNVAEIDESW